MWHWQGGIGSAASTLAGGRIGGGQDGVGGVRMSAMGGRVSVVGVWCHGRGQGGGCSPQQSQFFMGYLAIHFPNELPNSQINDAAIGFPKVVNSSRIARTV